MEQFDWRKLLQDYLEQKQRASSTATGDMGKLPIAPPTDYPKIGYGIGKFEEDQIARKKYKDEFGTEPPIGFGAGSDRNMEFNNYWKTDGDRLFQQVKNGEIGDPTFIGLNDEQLRQKLYDTYFSKWQNGRNKPLPPNPSRDMQPHYNLMQNGGITDYISNMAKIGMDKEKQPSLLDKLPTSLGETKNIEQDMYNKQMNMLPPKPKQINDNIGFENQMPDNIRQTYRTWVGKPKL